MTANGQSNGAQAPGDALPLIRIRVGFPQEAQAAAVESLASDPDLFTRDVDLVHVGRVTDDEQQDSAFERVNGETAYEAIAGSPRIHTMSLATLRVRMCEAALWERTKVTKDGPELVACEPTRAMAEELRDGKRWRGLRELAGVAETPFPRPDGVIVQGKAHYDRATKYLYEPSQRFLPVKDEPTLADAQASRRALEDLFVDFPFASPAGASACVAAAMTLVCRPAIRGAVPSWIIDATTPGTGKSLLADVISAIAFGRESGRAHFPNVQGRDGDSEIQKRLGTFARMGLPMVNFDNADESMIGSDALEECITARDKYLFRLLGETKGMLLPMRMVFFFTGNNVTWSRGMNRRILHVRLVSELENPEARPIETYKHKDRAGRLFEYVLEHRAEYVRHILTIVRAYFVANRPGKLTLGTFEAWAAIIPSALVWAGAVNPMLCRPSMSGEESTDTLQRQALAREWGAFCRNSGIAGITAHEMIERLYPLQERNGAPPPHDGWDTLRGAIEYFVPPRPGQNPDAAKLGEIIGKRFRQAPLRTHDAPAPLVRFEVEGKSGGRARWRVVPVAGGCVDTAPDRDDEPKEQEPPSVHVDDGAEFYEADLEADRIEREALREVEAVAAGPP